MLFRSRGEPDAGVWGSSIRTTPEMAAFANGVMLRFMDISDTYVGKNRGHPSDVIGGLMAAAEIARADGRAIINAIALAYDIYCSMIDAVEINKRGWDQPVYGVVATALGAGRLLGLTREQMGHAVSLALAPNMALGQSRAGALSNWKGCAGANAARNGLFAALLAREGFTAGEHSLEGPRGFAAVTAASYDLSKVTAKLGVDWDLRVNTYKPYPCGIVNHPTIDGCIQLREEHRLTPDQIAAVRLRVAPLVIDLCNQQNITKGLQGKFSVYHGAAVGLVRGKAGLQEYSDETVNEPAVKRVREATTAVGDPAVTEDQSRIEVQLADGRVLTKFVEASLGNLKRPLSDAQIGRAHV